MRHNKTWYISKSLHTLMNLFSQNHRVTEVQGDFWRSSDPALPAEAGVRLQQAAEDHVQMFFQYLQGWTLHNLSGKPLPLLSYSHNTKFSLCSDGTSFRPIYSFFPIHQWSEQVPGWLGNSVALCYLLKTGRNTVTTCLLSISAKGERWPVCQFSTLRRSVRTCYSRLFHHEL